ncbi:DUF945 family protein [Castellaniella hirudinis]|uniref:DUF945 family protein n=1 Tax=Castellaniella hirudinis TaxID=1144617 RepID=A0ABV8S278_9BURK
MNKKAAIGGAIAVCAAGWLGATWYTGQQIETRSRQYLEKANAQLASLSPQLGGLSLRLEQLGYDRGWFSSQARYGFSVINAADSGDMPSGTMEFTTRIDHGPFPKGALARGVFLPKLAAMHTELVRTANLEELFKLFDGVVPLTSDDIVSYGGRVRGTARIAPVKAENEAMRLDFSGMQFDGSYDFKHEALTLDARIDALNVADHETDKPTKINVAGIRITAATRLGKFGLSTGESALMLKRFDMDMPEKQVKFVLEDLGYTATATENESALSMTADYQVGKVTVNETPVGSFRTAVHFDNLDGVALKQLVDVFKQVGQVLAQEGKGDQSAAEALMPVLSNHVFKLLAGKPTVRIDPLLWKTDKGESRLTAAVTLTRPEPFDMEHLDQTVARMIQSIDARWDLSQPMLKSVATQYGTQFEDQSPEEAAAKADEMVDGMLGMAQMMNAGKIEGDHFIGTFTYADGMGRLNGKEIPADELFKALASTAEDAADQMAGDDDVESAVAGAAETGEILTDFSPMILDFLAEQDQSPEAGDRENTYWLDPSSMGADSLLMTLYCNDESQCLDLMLTATYKSKRSVTLKEINAWSREYRWVRAYLNEQNQPVVEMDLNAAGGIGKENLAILYRTFVDIGADFANEVIGD